MDSWTFTHPSDLCAILSSVLPYLEDGRLGGQRRRFDHLLRAAEAFRAGRPPEVWEEPDGDVVLLVECAECTSHYQLKLWIHHQGRSFGYGDWRKLAVAAASTGQSRRSNPNALTEYRVTKHNPILRDPHGAYTRDEWTSVTDIGASFGGETLTFEEYERVEHAHVEVAMAFLQEAGLSALTVEGLESHGGARLSFAEHSVLDHARIEQIIPRILREELWCLLEAESGFLHFGYDYSMYVGVPFPCPKARALAHRLGLFVEDVRSPYRKRDTDD